MNKKSLFALSAIAFSISAHAASIDEFKQSWTAKALKLQDKIDVNTPINHATILGTHNSYNSESYRSTLSYHDPNQTLSIYDQLEMGMRSVEFDAHWSTLSDLKKEIVLCHSGKAHHSCTYTDRPITEGLKEVAAWLKENPNEFVVLYIERHVDGHEPRLASYLDEYLGEYIYKPEVRRNQQDTTKSCVPLPSEFTKADALKAGKQLIVVTKGCSTDDSSLKEQDHFYQNWNDFVFSGVGQIPKHENTFIDTKIDKLTPYPDCGASTAFKDDAVNHTSTWRIYEDRRDSTDPSDMHIESKDMQEMMRCNTNWVAVDKLQIDDERLKSVIWSWAPNYPVEGKGQCAVYHLNEGIVNEDCTGDIKSYACLDESKQQMQMALVAGSWENGETACQANDTSWHFVTPVNGRQLDELKSLMSVNDVDKVWLNYVEDKGVWMANPVERR